MTVEPRVLSVTIEPDAAAGQASAVESALAHYGIAADVKSVGGRRGAELMPWLIEISVVGPILAFFESFGSTFGRTPVAEPFSLVRAWIKALWAARADSGTGEGSIEISDSDGTTLVVMTGLPDGALDELADVPWNDVRGRLLVWDDTARGWRARIGEDAG